MLKSGNYSITTTALPVLSNLRGGSLTTKADKAQKMTKLEKKLKIIKACF